MYIPVLSLVNNLLENNEVITQIRYTVYVYAYMIFKYMALTLLQSDAHAPSITVIKTTLPLRRIFPDSFTTFRVD